MKIAEVGNVEIPQNTVNMKSGMREEAPQTQEQDPKEALTNPMETVGRSQVNFNGAKKAIKQLTAKELNMITNQVVEKKLDFHEVKVAKQALIDTMNEYGCKSVKDFATRIVKGIEDSNYEGVAEEMLGKFEQNVSKIDPKVDIHRATSIIDDYIMMI